MVPFQVLRCSLRWLVDQLKVLCRSLQCFVHQFEVVCKIPVIMIQHVTNVKMWLLLLTRHSLVTYAHWFHISCIDGMTETAHAALINGSECDDLKWFCMKCPSCIQTLVQNVNDSVSLTFTSGTVHKQIPVLSVLHLLEPTTSEENIYQNPYNFV